MVVEIFNFKVRGEFLVGRAYRVAERITWHTGTLAYETRSSRRTQPAARKRTQSNPQPTTQKSKKTKTQKPKTQKPPTQPTQVPKSRNPKSKTSLPSRPPPTQSEIEPLEFSDKDRRLREQQLCTKQSHKNPSEKPESPPDQQAADEDEQEETAFVEDDAVEEEEAPFNFRTTWRALCGKEHLPGIQSGCYTKETLDMVHIDVWKRQVLSNLQPRSFKVVSLVATASYEKCRQADEFPQELRSSLDLNAVLGCLEEWHRQSPRRALTLKVTLQLDEEKPIESTPAQPQRAQAAQPQSTQAQSRRTATLQQLNSLPQMLEAEELSGNHMPAIADRWACMNARCRNKGKTCWRSKAPGAPDTADDHYPIPSDMFRRWSKEVNDKISTVEQPSPHLIVAICKFRDRSSKKDESRTKSDQQSTATTEASTTSTLINALLVTQLRQLNQPLPSAPAASSLLVERPALAGSSPFRTQKD